MAKKHWEKVRKAVAGLPGTEEGTSYGTAAFHVARKFLCRVREDGVTLALRLSIDEREMLIEQEPEIYFVTDHYRNYPAILVNLDLVRLDALRALVKRSWHEVAPAKLLKQGEAEVPREQTVRKRR